MNKRIPIGVRPSVDPRRDAWVRGERSSDLRQEGGAKRVDPERSYTARLSIDVSPTLRGRIKVAAYNKGMTLADAVRELLEREFPPREGR